MLGLPHCPRAVLVWFFQTKLFRPSENTFGPVSWLGWCLCLCNGNIGSSIVWLCLDDFFTCGTAFPSKLWLSAYNLNITVLKRSCSTSPSFPTNSNYPSQPLRHRTRFQVEYNLIYPYISYAITSWGSAFTTQIKKIQTKQNHQNFQNWIMLSALCSLPPCLDRIQTVHYHYLIYWIYLLLQISINYSFLLTHQWHSKKLPNIFNQHFRYASEVHTYNTRCASKQK